MGGKSKTTEKSRTTGTTTTTPTYQEYAGKYATGMGEPALQAYQQAMQGYAGIQGYNPYQQALWSQVGQEALGQYGTQGPYAQAAQQYIQPYLGQGYMQTLEPYYQQQQQYIQQALPQTERAYLQQLKNQFGPAWGTSGKALAAAGESYANWKANVANTLANLEAQKAAAAQQGMQYGAQVAPTYANLVNPFTWGQQAIGWAGAPETALTEAQKSQQQLAAGWSSPLMQLAQLGYAYPQYTTTAGEQVGRGTSVGAQGGVSCCFIMNEAKDLTDYVRRIRDEWCPTGKEHIANGYRKMALWLVPIMKKSSIVKGLVKWTMTHPIAVACEKRNVALYPIGFSWIAIWSLYGRMTCTTSKDILKATQKFGVMR